MGKQFTLTTTDKHSLGAYRADPKGAAKGGLVVVQEIFGVNHHIRAVCDRLAALGYVAVAPAVFDRFVRNFECGYTPDEIAHARSYLGNLNWDHMMADIAAGVGDLKGAGPARRDRLLHGRHRGVSGGLPDSRPVGGGRLLRRHDRQVRRREAEMPAADAFRREGRRHSDETWWTRSRRSSRRRKSTSIRARRTASIATSAPATARKSADLAWSRTQEFLGKHMKK